MPLCNVKTILLFDRRHVRPDLIKEMAEAEDGGVLLCDPAVLNAFTPLTIMEPVDKKGKFKAILLVNKRQYRPEVVKALLAAKHMDMLSIDPALLDAFTPIIFSTEEMPRVDKAGMVTPKKKRAKKKTTRKPKEK